MCVNNLPKVATQWNSGATRDSNRGRRVLIPSALTTTPPSHTYSLFRIKMQQTDKEAYKPEGKNELNTNTQLRTKLQNHRHKSVY